MSAPAQDREPTPHTPGPWTATCDDDDTEEADMVYAGKIPIARVLGEDEIRHRINRGKPEKIGSTSGPDALDEVDANARLIAAAPALLEVVEAMARFDGRNDNTHLKEMARAALALARGE